MPAFSSLTRASCALTASENAPTCTIKRPATAALAAAEAAGFCAVSRPSSRACALAPSSERTGGLSAGLTTGLAGAEAAPDTVPVEARDADAAGATTAGLAADGVATGAGGLLTCSLPASDSTTTSAAGLTWVTVPSGLTVFLSGISMGISTEIGRGWLSNSSGKPITPTSTSTDAPINRWRARVRMASTLSVAGAGVA